MHGTAFSLFLIGPRASGKSTVGRLVADSLGLPFYDTDDMVMDEAGRSIAELVRLEGWESFREREARALVLAAGRGLAGAVVATGGGMVLSRKNREFMRAHGLVVYLAAPPDCLRDRLEGRIDADRRPSLTGEPPLAELAGVLEEREPLYREAAHQIVDAGGPGAAVARTVAGLLEHSAGGAL